MDSIGDNVMAIICVVVGILIIGCALVPIVDNASVVEIETESTQEVSGYNAISTDYFWVGPLKETTIVANGSTVTLDGVTATKSFAIYSNIGNSNAYLWASQGSHKFEIHPLLSGEESMFLVTGTVTYVGDQLTISGTRADNTSYSKTVTSDTLYINYEDGYEGASDTEIYGRATGTFNIGADQRVVSLLGDTSFNIESTTLPANVTMAVSENGSYATITTNGTWYAPYKWTGTDIITETTTADSEYKDLYNIIPVLCILGMAYVLIRRFY